jgi:DNA-binding transcriptional ArsR family regulator
MYPDEEDGYEEDYGYEDEEPGKRIQFPRGSATFFNNKVFEEVFPWLGRRPSERDTEAFYSDPFRRHVPRVNKPHLQIVYSFLYSACFHKRKKLAKLSVTDIARGTGIDWRTVKRDLFWLEQSHRIEEEREGRSRSRTSAGKSLWSVPLADFDMKTQHFTPVPKFIVEKYVPVYPRAIILPVLQYVRQWRSRAGYWVENAQATTGWPLRTIYRALGVLGNLHQWSKQIHADHENKSALPYPIEVKEQKLNLRYLDFPRSNLKSIYLTREFKEHFFPDEPVTE